MADDSIKEISLMKMGLNGEVNDIFDDKLNYEKVLDKLVFKVPCTNAIYYVKFISENNLKIKYIINKYGMDNEADERVSKTLYIGK